MTKISIKKNLLFSSSSQFITIIASFIANWFLSRYLGPDLRGRYVYLFTINSIIWMLLDIGIVKTFAFTIQHDKADPKKLYSYTLAFFGISLVISFLVFGFVLPSFHKITGFDYPKLILIALGIYIVTFQLFNRLKSMFMGLNRIQDYALLSFLPTLSFMILMLPTFWIVPKEWRMEYAFVLNVSTMLICILIFHFRLSKIINMTWMWDSKLIKRSYALGYKAFLSEYLIILMTRIDQLILKKLGSFSQLGIYTLSVNFLDMINTFCNMFGAILLTKFSSIADDTESLAILRKAFLLVTLINIICIAGMVLIGRFMIVFLYGSVYLGAYWSFILLIPAIFGLTLGALFNTFLWSKGFPIFTVLAPIIPLLLKIILNYLLIPHYSYYGSAIASSICYPLWFIILLIWYFTTHPEHKPSLLFPQKKDFFEAVQMLKHTKSQITLWINE
jgi:O-antigen/teichoic acid export membrane protein